MQPYLCDVPEMVTVPCLYCVVGLVYEYDDCWLGDWVNVQYMVYIWLHTLYFNKNIE